MKKGYLIGLFAACTLLMMGCSNQQKDPVTDPDAPAVTDSMTEGEADVAGMDTGSDNVDNASSQSSVANTTGSSAVSTGKSSTTSSNKSSKTTEKQSKKESSSSSQSEDIGMEAAKKIALGKAGLTGQDGSWKEEKRDWDNGRLVYELEYVSGKIEYEFEIDAQNGKILEYQQDPIDD